MQSQHKKVTSLEILAGAPWWQSWASSRAQRRGGGDWAIEPFEVAGGVSSASLLEHSFVWEGVILPPWPGPHLDHLLWVSAAVVGSAADTLLLPQRNLSKHANILPRDACFVIFNSLIMLAMEARWWIMCPRQMSLHLEV